MTRAAFLLLLAALGLGACSTVPEWRPDTKAPEVYGVGYRKYAPDPVYNRLRWVHLPSPSPSSRLPVSDAEQLAPALHLEIKGGKLEDAARALASSARFTSYTASTVADKRVSLNQIGSLEELAEALAKQSGARVVVDHSLRQLRFLGGVQTPPVQ